MKTTIKYAIICSVFVWLFLGNLSQCSNIDSMGSVDSTQTADIAQLRDSLNYVKSVMQNLEAVFSGFSSRLAALEPEAPDTTMVFGGTVVLYHITSESWPFDFYHTFADVNGGDEVSIQFEVGYQKYASLAQVADSAYTSVWQGFRTVKLRLADLNEWSAEAGFRKEFREVMYGLEVGRYYVFSTCTVDAAGNQSAWTTSLDSSTVPRPYIVTRVQ